MIIGYVPGEGWLHRAHPFTALTVAGAAAAMAFVLPAPFGSWLVVATLCAIAFGARLGGALTTTLVFSAPFWMFLALIYGVFGDDPRLGISLAGRITAILLGFLLALAAVHPGKLVEAMVERRVPFSIAYLFAATLQAVPRLQEQATAILEAQRCRGLRSTGSPWRRVRSVVPLALPLVQGALVEADERAVALEIRGAVAGRQRTPLDPPRDSALDRTARWGMALLLVGTIMWRLLS